MKNKNNMSVSVSIDADPEFIDAIATQFGVN